MQKQYLINEVFYSLQGEGVRMGTANVFIRFAGCNMRCEQEAGSKSPGGFDCDTEFESGRKVDLDELWWWLNMYEHPSCNWIILTGGEPGLQVDDEFINHFKCRGHKLAIETNGSVALPDGLDWITVSPKVAEYCIKQTKANEVKYVRGYGQAIPKTVVKAEHKLISPAFNGVVLDPKTLEWCIELVKENPEWQLSQQMHKAWSIR